MTDTLREKNLHWLIFFSGPFPVGDKQNKLQGMDTQILIDALAVIMGHEEKELCKPGNLALVLILETATTILGSKERVGDDLRVGGGILGSKERVGGDLWFGVGSEGGGDQG